MPAPAMMIFLEAMKGGGEGDGLLMFELDLCVCIEVSRLCYSIGEGRLYWLGSGSSCSRGQHLILIEILCW
jgi:hypothetical protein